MADTLPRVSDVLTVLDPEAYGSVPQHVLDVAAERGQALHRLACQYLASLMGRCSAPTEIPAEYVAAYDGVLEWVRERQIVPTAVEQEGENLRYGFIGHPDLLCLYGPKQIETLIDLKFTAAILRINHVQVRAYWELDGFTSARQAFLVHVDHETGRWTDTKNRVSKTGSEWPAFMSALQVQKWRMAA